MLQSRPPASFSIARIGTSVNILADKRGLLFTCNAGNRLDSREAWPADAIAARHGMRTAIELEQLLELGYAQVSDTSVFIPYEKFHEVDAFDVDITHRWTGWSPFLLKIDRFGDIGRPDFKYRYEFLRGGAPVFLDRLRYYVRRAGTDKAFRLDQQTYVLVEAMDTFNAAEGTEKTPTSSWLSFAEIKRAAGDVGAALDSALQKNDVIVPSNLALSMVEDEQGRLTFLPRCSEVADSDFAHVFARNADAEPVYSLTGADGKRVRIVLTDKQQEVLRRMKSVRAVGDSRRESLKTNPAQVFDGLLDAVELPYSDRVIGIGDFEFVPIPRPSSGEPGMGAIWGDVRGQPPTVEEAGDIRPSAEKQRERHIGLPQGTDTPGAHAGQAETSQLDDSSTEPALGGEPGSKAKKYLLIHTNQDQISQQSAAAAAAAAALETDAHELERPSALLPDIQLQPHQSDGVRWLQTCTRVANRSGVLLADDMGLGKTLQILSFLAWGIETDRFPDLSSEAPPWRPALIVVPLILLENRTWQSEMEKFFANQGSIFLPVAALHGGGIDQFKVSRAGREIEIGKPVLDLDRLQRHRIVITNYDTLKNYQHSLAHFRFGKSLWSLLVTDEAQQYKIPNTKISHSIKALKPDFHIACTGTPVENRLLDLWNLYDTVQPGLLRSAREFTHKYEQKVDSGERETALQDLKERLLFQRPHAFLLRRSKSELATLPPKHHHRIRCAMSSRETELHEMLVGALRGQRNRISHLAVLQRLAQLYQHPALLSDDGPEVPVPQLVAQSSKLGRVCQELHRIRAAGQKAIVFTRHRGMQTILSRTFEQEFHMPVRIINGLTKSSSLSGATGGGSRAAILNEFKNANGFRVIVLSPFVAGIGLTITEANHVFHYGRWWNPAVESQATDRAYRIGQTRDVHVYLPILFDESGRISNSFDERLDQLMERKARLAEDFLRPMESEDDIAEQLYTELANDAETVASDADSPVSDDELTPAFVACCLECLGYSVAIIRAGYSHGIDVLAKNSETVLAIRVGRLPVYPKEAVASLRQLRSAAESYSSTVGRAIAPAIISLALPVDVRASAHSERIRVLTPTDLGLPSTRPMSGELAIRTAIEAVPMQQALSLVMNNG